MWIGYNNCNSLSHGVILAKLSLSFSLICHMYFLNGVHSTHCARALLLPDYCARIRWSQRKWSANETPFPQPPNGHFLLCVGVAFVSSRSMVCGVCSWLELRTPLSETMKLKQIWSKVVMLTVRKELYQDRCLSAVEDTSWLSESFVWIKGWTILNLTPESFKELFNTDYS